VVASCAVGIVEMDVGKEQRIQVAYQRRQAQVVQGFSWWHVVAGRFEGIQDQEHVEAVWVGLRNAVDRLPAAHVWRCGEQAKLGIGPNGNRGGGESCVGVEQKRVGIALGLKSSHELGTEAANLGLSALLSLDGDQVDADPHVPRAPGKRLP
jgi:hypothetical protein